MTILKHQGKKDQLQKTLTRKKVDDLKNKIKKLSRTEAYLKEQIKQRSEKLKSLQRDLDKNQAFLVKIKSSIEALESETETRLNERDLNSAHLVQLQTRAKWYRLIKEKRYRLVIRDEGGGSGMSDLGVLMQQNIELKEALEELENEHVHLKPSIRKIKCSLSDSRHV